MKLKYEKVCPSRPKIQNNKRRLISRLDRDGAKASDAEMTALDFEEELEQSETKQEQKKLRSKRAHKVITRIFQILVAIASVYIVFLIYGLFMTDYKYDEKGNIVPEIVSVEEIKNREIFTLLYRHYLQARTLYEDILRLDYQLSLDAESKLLAMEYEDLLDRVSSLVVAIDALSVETKYGQFKNMLLEWVRTDVAVYLQNISAAILQNSEEKASEAIACRNQMYDDFLILSENMAAIGEAVPGAVLTSLYEWSPETFVSEVLEGVKNE